MGDAIGTRQAAEILGVSPRRVRQYVEKGRLPATLLGHDLVFDETKVQKFASQERLNGRHVQPRKAAKE